MTEALLSLGEVASLLKVSKRTVQRLPLRHTKVGRLPRYYPSDVQRYLEKRATRKAAAA